MESPSNKPADGNIGNEIRARFVTGRDRGYDDLPAGKSAVIKVRAASGFDLKTARAVAALVKLYTLA